LDLMRRLVWKPEKNEWLIKARGLSFEQIEEAIASGNLKGMLRNRSHPEQIILAVAVEDKIVAVPATVRPTVIVLRTAYYSRKLGKRCGGKRP
jgi:hypothetical protein